MDILREEHPDWNAQQLKEAEEALDQYFEVVMRIYERIRRYLGLHDEFKRLLLEQQGKPDKKN